MTEIRLLPLNRDLAEKRPMAARYAQIYGLGGLIPEPWNDVDLKSYKNSEQVYRDCLKKGVTWKELLDYKPRTDIVL